MTGDGEDFFVWLSDNRGRFKNLTESVTTIIKSLLDENHIDYLSVTGRVKEIGNCMEKAERKAYKYPQDQMTDISGVRIVLYFEGQIKIVSDIIRKAFRIDSDNSSDTSSRMSANQVGYRSVHFVCDIGSIREALPEFSRLSGLKFEVQIRTVLQHAWAEMAHDRNYKFRGTLPTSMERKLFLLAGLLETADQGFQDLSVAIDSYRETLVQQADQSPPKGEIDWINLEVFMDNWASNNGVKFSIRRRRISLNNVIVELKQYGIEKLDDLANIIPDGYASVLMSSNEKRTPIGVIRDWMIIHDLDRFLKRVHVDWVLGDTANSALRSFLTQENFNRLSSALGE